MQTAENTTVQSADVTFVIAQTDEGFRVYSPLTPGKQYVVTGVPDHPQCTCQEFTSHEGDPEWLCKHILAVLKQNGAPAPGGHGSTDTANSKAVPAARAEKKSAKSDGNGAMMLLKRSVSPDGRIDSLSVEFSCPVGRETPETVKQRAERILALQGEIAGQFLRTNGNGTSRRTDAASAVAAQLLAVASMNGRYGKRLFLNVLVNGQILKFFGSDKQLAEAVTAAGFGSVAEHIADGYTLNLPCRVVTKPSQDGKYINVERILPTQEAASK